MRPKRRNISNASTSESTKAADVRNHFCVWPSFFASLIRVFHTAKTKLGLVSIHPAIFKPRSKDRKQCFWRSMFSEHRKAAETQSGGENTPASRRPLENAAEIVQELLVMEPTDRLETLVQAAGEIQQRDAEGPASSSEVSELDMVEAEIAYHLQDLRDADQCCHADCVHEMLGYTEDLERLLLSYLRPGSSTRDRKIYLMSLLRGLQPLERRALLMPIPGLDHVCRIAFCSLFRISAYEFTQLRSYCDAGLLFPPPHGRTGMSPGNKVSSGSCFAVSTFLRQLGARKGQPHTQDAPAAAAAAAGAAGASDGVVVLPASFTVECVLVGFLLPVY
jgi:hypothetical protein